MITIDINSSATMRKKKDFKSVAERVMNALIPAKGCNCSLPCC